MLSRALVAEALVAGMVGVALWVVPTGLAQAASSPAPCSAGLIALTFDDGPAPSTTIPMIEVLTARHVPATFFMVGSRVKAHPALVRKVARLGFVIGNHTFRHESLTALSGSGIRATLTHTRRALVRAGVRPSSLMRPPYRATDARVRSVVDSMGLTQVLWTIDSRDWESGSADDIATRVLRALQPHQANVVLLHDGIGRSTITLKAVPKIVAGARLRGYCFAVLGPGGRAAPPVPTLLASAPQAVEGGSDESSQVTVTLRLDQPTSRQVSLRVRTIPVTAVDGEDYVGVSQRVVFPVGTTRRNVAITILGDDTPEGAETFLVSLDRAYRLRVDKETLTVTIMDDEVAPPGDATGASFPPPLDQWAAVPPADGGDSVVRSAPAPYAEDGPGAAINLGLLVLAAASGLAFHRLAESRPSSRAAVRE